MNVKIKAKKSLTDLEPEKQIEAAAEVTQRLIEVTVPQNKSLLPNDLRASARILTAVVDVLENNNATNEVRIKLFSAFILCTSIWYVSQDVVEVFNNILDDSNREGWRSLQSVSPLTHNNIINRRTVIVYI